MKNKIVTFTLIASAMVFAQKNEQPKETRSVEKSKSIELIEQEIFAEGIGATFIFENLGSIEEADVHLDRDFSEYLTRTLDRESIERIHHEN